MKFFNLKSMIGMFLILFMAACQDDTGSGAKVEEGLAAKLNLSIQVPAVEEVNTRTIADNESQINELALFMYSVNSDLHYRVDLTGKLTEEGKATANGYRSYTVNEVPVQTGTFTIYAVANWSSRFANCNLSDDIFEEQLKAMMGNGDDVYQLQPGDYLPMTDIVKDVTFYTGEEATKNELHLSLKRATARIEFTVQNGEALNAVQGEFIPSTFQVFNLPSSSYLFDQGDNMVSTDDYFNSEVMDVNEDGSFEFLMNENVRPAGDNIKEYQDREYYEGNWTNPTSFKNAPEGSTYVVINGYYRDNRQSGPVSYRIHLGNFSRTTGSIMNFTVNRNEQHLYKVTVNGIENISTDVEVKNPGAYGDVQVRTLEFASEPEAQDAHYVIYPIKIKTDNLIGNWKVAVADAENHKWVTLKTELSTLQQAGFWTENELGGSVVEGSGNGEHTVYVFLEENAAADAQMRTATLQLYQKDYPESKIDFTVSQLPVNWNSSFGNERIEDGMYPWGFNWDRTVTYHSGVFIWRLILKAIADSYIADYGAGNYVTSNYDFWTGTDVIINYGLLDNLGETASSSSDGLQNTIELYNYQGIGEVSELERIFDFWFNDKRVEGDTESVQDFAAKICVMKNKFRKEERQAEGDGETQTYDVAVLTEDGIKWYLPANDEYSNINDVSYPLQQSAYWTSTAASDNTHAYIYRPDSGLSTAERMGKYYIRAARVRN